MQTRTKESRCTKLEREEKINAKKGKIKAKEEKRKEEREWHTLQASKSKKTKKGNNILSGKFPGTNGSQKTESFLGWPGSKEFCDIYIQLLLCLEALLLAPSWLRSPPCASLADANSGRATDGEMAGQMGARMGRQTGCTAGGGCKVLKQVLMGSEIGCDRFCSEKIGCDRF